MRPIYYPQTYIPVASMAAIQTCFSPVVVYQPSRRDVPTVMREWEQGELIELIVPPKGDGDRLALVLKDYRNWAAMHGGQHRTGFDYFRSHMGKVPYFDETSVAQIRVDIKRGGIPRESASVSRFFSARVFLSIAQEMDMGAESLATDMLRHDEFEKKLFRELNGGAPAPQPASPVATDSGMQQDYMIQERLRAWWLLVAGVAESADTNLSGIFVTTSRPAVDLSVDVMADAVKMFTMEDIPLVGNNPQVLKNWRRQLLDRLQLVTRGNHALEKATGIDWPMVPKLDDAAQRLKLTAFLIAGKSPRALFHKTVGLQTDSLKKDQTLGSEPENTIIVLIEI